MIHYRDIDDNGCACGTGEQRGTSDIFAVTCLDCINAERNSAVTLERECRKMLLAVIRRRERVCKRIQELHDKIETAANKKPT